MQCITVNEGYFRLLSTLNECSLLSLFVPIRVSIFFGFLSLLLLLIYASLPWDNLRLYAMFLTEVTAPYPHPSFSSNLVIGCNCTRLTAYRTSRLCRTRQSRGIQGEQTARN